MAKKHRSHSRSLVRHSSPKPIVIRTTKIVKHKKKHHSSRRGGGMASLFSKDRVTTIGAGFAVGALEKMAFVQNLPKLPFLGTTGTIGVGAFLLSGGRRGMVDDVATAALTIAGYMMGSSGSIVGDGSGYTADGYVAGFGG